MWGHNSREQYSWVEVAARAPLERAGGMQHRWGRDRDRCSNLHRFYNEAPIPLGDDSAELTQAMKLSALITDKGIVRSNRRFLCALTRLPTYTVRPFRSSAL